MASPVLQPALRPIRRRLAILFLSVPLLLAGCMFQTYGPDARVPLQIEAETPPDQAVAVSMVTSTAPLCWIKAMKFEYHPLPAADWAISVEKIEFLDLSKPTLFVPAYTQAMMCFIFQSKGHGLALFAPGCLPAVYTGEMPIHGGLVRSVEQPDHTWAAVTRWRVVTTAAAEQRGAGGAGSEDPYAALLYILGKDQFWGALQWRYLWGQGKAEIETICRTIVQAAQACHKAKPDRAWTRSEQSALDWCREVDAKAASRKEP
jgi:hypothetical protein